VIHKPLSIGVYPRPDDHYTDLTATEVRGPLALRIGRNGSVTFLGHVEAPSDSGLTWSVTAADTRFDDLPLGNVLAVEGWLSTIISTCGPAPIPGPTIHPPFACGVSDVLSRDPGVAPNVSPFGGDEAGLWVQKGAYGEFAEDPQRTGTDPWRFGTYLVQRVANRNDNCQGCEGWLMIGRLGSAATGTLGAEQPLSPDDPRIQDPSGLALGTVANVRGWLVDTGAPIPGHPEPMPTAPRDSPWEPCGAAWLSPSDFQPVQGSPETGWSWVPPPGGVSVQPRAYRMFAPDPSSSASLLSTPRFGTYALRLIADTRPGREANRGWQVIGRLQP
jgi:hypothetical protein